MLHSRSLLTLVSAIAMSAAAGGQPAPPGGGDWPQWRGPDRNGISKETGLLRQWDAAGPVRLWSTRDIGAGYGSMAIAGDRIYVQGLKGRESGVSALNRADGKVIWWRPLGGTTEDDRGPGPRGTPTVDGDRLFVLTESGDLAALRPRDGSVLWRRNILKEFGAANIPWLISESPLVDGERLVVTPGGPGSTMVALDKASGRTIWTTRELSDAAGYASVVAADVQGVRTLMTLTAEGGVGVRASDGKVMWNHRPVANRTANITTPVFFDNKVFYTSAYGTGGALLGLQAESGLVKARELYFTRDMQNHHGGVLVVNGHLYGYNNAILTCLDFSTGKLVWRDRSVGKGAVVYADGHLYIVGENNVVGLVEATPAGYREKGRFEIADEGWPSWAHPAVSGGRLYIRNQGTLAAYTIRASRDIELR
jgi:outer membrane protein assembly factor BamB